MVTGNVYSLGSLILALVVRAAGQAGCVVLSSEGMQDRREVDGAGIVNRFQ
jgi:predicted nucleic acid-binding protein